VTILLGTVAVNCPPAFDVLAVIHGNRIRKAGALSDLNPNTVFRQIRQVASQTFVITAFASSLGLLTSALLAHWLGPKDFGVYSYILALTGLATVVSSLGLPTIVLRHSAVSLAISNWGAIKGLLLYSSTLTLLTSACVGLVIAILGVRIGHFRYFPGFHTDLILAIVLMALGIQSGLLMNVMQGLNKIVASILSGSLAAPTALIIVLAVMRLRTGAVDLSVVLTWQVMLALGLLVIQVIQVVRAVPREFFQSTAQLHAVQWLVSALPFLLNSVMITINLRTDIFLLGILKGPEYAGIYNAASKGALLLVMPLGALVTASRPTIARLYAQTDTARLQSVLTMTSRLSTLISLFGTLIVVVFGQSLLRILFGPAFALGASALIILSLARVINAGTGSLQPFLSMTNRPRPLAIGLGSEACLNVGLNYLLIPILGMNGSALATGGSMALANIALSIWTYRTCGYDVSVLGRHSRYLNQASQHNVG
jgi:O-antigen/teichoic acid export membrane protein